MRNLTIKRTKSFVGCFAALTVCIEDATSAEITIGGVACRKLGKLKNGEEVTFPVTTDEVRIYVIADTLSKDYCNEVFRIPAGENDVNLSGGCRLNPATGNAFRFDGSFTEETLQNRKRGIKLGWVVLAVFFVIGVIIGLFIISPVFSSLFDALTEPKTFEVDDFNITLTDGFTPDDPRQFAAFYNSKKVLVFIEKADFTDAPGLDELTVDEYTDLLIEMHSSSTDTGRLSEGNLTYFISSTDDDDDKLVYYFFIYKGPSAFWIVQFVSHAVNESANRPDIFEWAKTVTFDNGDT